ncbi:hypothetical protein BU14_0105s0029 [Porphyra umbilicalis]|uniref:Uncharacterized protein n=1 Tax=Porphyra umbilicalis TaxID=2786 RepID=A0A1X6PCK0_PORUM|nr:hypothetical protein BU14_0105s0029 [Porphyra umbilicalis]|eukprot:OSX78611.1 hypothetical protein BU14_0105s0029 [Porphyra umbilicalis]
MCSSLAPTWRRAARSSLQAPKSTRRSGRAPSCTASPRPCSSTTGCCTSAPTASASPPSARRRSGRLGAAARRSGTRRRGWRPPPRRWRGRPPRRSARRGRCLGCSAASWCTSSSTGGSCAAAARCARSPWSRPSTWRTAPCRAGASTMRGTSAGWWRAPRWRSWGGPAIGSCGVASSTCRWGWPRRGGCGGS